MKNYMIKLTMVLFLIIGFIMISNPAAVYARDKENNPNTYEKLVEDVFNRIKNRETSFSIVYTGDAMPIMKKEVNIASDVLAIDDYTRWSYAYIHTRMIQSRDDLTLNFTVKYYTTLEQEKYIENYIDKILKEIINDTMSERQKIDAISNWILNLLTYDDTLQNRDVYTALTQKSVVCQGYAMILDKMCERAGIRSELVEGGLNGNPDGHAWNVVLINNEWYYIDLTNVDDPINLPYYMLTKEELKSYNFVWDESLINLNKTKEEKNENKEVEFYYDSSKNKIIVSNTGTKKVEIFYNPDVFNSWKEYSNSKGYKNKLYDGYAKTEDGRYFGYYLSKGWSLYDSGHVYANKDGIINPSYISSGKYTVLLRITDENTTTYKVIDFQVGKGNKKGTTGLKTESYFNDILKTPIVVKQSKNVIKIDTTNSALLMKSYQIDNGKIVTLSKPLSTYEIETKLKNGKHTIKITFETLYKDGYGLKRKHTINKTFQI